MLGTFPSCFAGPSPSPSTGKPPGSGQTAWASSSPPVSSVPGARCSTSKGPTDTCQCILAMEPGIPNKRYCSIVCAVDLGFAFKCGHLCSGGFIVYSLFNVASLEDGIQPDCD